MLNTGAVDRFLSRRREQRLVEFSWLTADWRHCPAIAAHFTKKRNFSTAGKLHFCGEINNPD